MKHTDLLEALAAEARAFHARRSAERVSLDAGGAALGALFGSGEREDQDEPAEPVSAAGEPDPEDAPASSEPVPSATPPAPGFGATTPDEAAFMAALNGTDTPQEIA